MTLHQYSSTPDESAMLAVRDGDIGQLGTLFDRYQRRIFSFCMRLTRDRGSSEDLLQEVFLRILKYRSTFTESSCFKTWAYRIARNACNDHFSRNPAPHVLVDDAMLEALGGVSLPPDLEKAEKAEILHQALGQLPTEQREVLVLSRFENMKYDQIAEIVGCAPGTVKVRVFRALKELQKLYFRTSGERKRWNVHR